MLSVRIRPVNFQKPRPAEHIMQTQQKCGPFLTTVGLIEPAIQYGDA
jgi:hypothetical protein